MEARHADQDRGMAKAGGTVLVGFLVLFAVLIGRLVHINTTSLSDRVLKIVHAQQIGHTPLPARRGCILDVHGRVMAGTHDKPCVFADPSIIDDFMSAASRLAPVLAMDAGEIEQTLRENSGRRFCWLKRWIEPADALAVKALKMPGVGVRLESKRLYPFEELCATTVGFVGVDNVGLEGMEARYDKHLRGSDGRHSSIYNGHRKRRPIWWRQEQSTAPKDGGHVVLTIDAVVQEIAQRHLSATVEEFQAASGTVVVMNPHTGELLAVAQVPSFDPDRFGEFSAAMRRNRAVCDVFEPGSIFKPFVASGALAAGIVNTTEEFDCGNGTHRFGGRTLHDTSPRGVLTLDGILAKSSNIGMGLIGERMGDVALHDTVRAFGFGKATGIDFAGEAKGILHALDRWTSYSVTSVPMGQEIAVTPIQLATAFSALVNGGLFVKPVLVDSLIDARGHLVRSTKRPEVVRRVIPKETSDYMLRRALRAVVLEGGGRKAALKDWNVVGKTGTAEISDGVHGGYEEDAYDSSFLGAAPMENPRCVVLVTVHRPQADIAYYGSRVAAPAAGRILGETLAYLHVPPSPVTVDGDGL